MIEAEHSNRVEIAVLKEQISGLREQHRAHSESTSKRFDGVESKIDQLLEGFNKSRGIGIALVIAAGIIGAALSKAIGILLGGVRP